jgi:Zn-finger in ubiquitin-hydrolases and other protein
MSATCMHLDEILDPPPVATGCVECLAIGSSWVHLRRCMTCGHIGCCNSSPNRHASEHALVTAHHPIVQSYEPGEDWLWCNVDQIAFELEDQMDSVSHPPGWSPGPPRDISAAVS